MKTIHRNIVYLRSRKIERRNLIEEYCKAAETLQAKKAVLFCLYYRHGYSTVKLGKLLGIDSTSVARRLNRIEKKIERILGNRAGAHNRLNLPDTIQTEKRTCRLVATVSIREYNDIRIRANKSNCSISEYVREHIL